MWSLYALRVCRADVSQTLTRTVLREGRVELRVRARCRLCVSGWTATGSGSSKARTVGNSLCCPCAAPRKCSRPANRYLRAPGAARSRRLPTLDRATTRFRSYGIDSCLIPVGESEPATPSPRSRVPKRQVLRNLHTRPCLQSSQEVCEGIDVEQAPMGRSRSALALAQPSDRRPICPTVPFPASQPAGDVILPADWCRRSLLPSVPSHCQAVL